MPIALMGMMKSKTNYSTSSNGDAFESLHLSGLLTRYDPERSVCGSSDQWSGRLRAQTAAASKTAHSRTVTRMPVMATADPLTELGILSAQAIRGGIGGRPLVSGDKRVPIGVISVLVVIVATSLVGFVCRRPLGNMLVFGPAPFDNMGHAHRVSAALPQRTPSSTLADSTPGGWKYPATSVPPRPNPSQKSLRRQRVGGPGPDAIAGKFTGRFGISSSNPPGALFTHIGTSH